MEMLEAEKDIRRTLDPRPIPPASSPRPSLPQSEEPENIIQPPPVNLDAEVSAVVPDNESDNAENPSSKHD